MRRSHHHTSGCLTVYIFHCYAVRSQTAACIPSGVIQDRAKETKYICESFFFSVFLPVCPTTSVPAERGEKDHENKKKEYQRTRLKRWSPSRIKPKTELPFIPRPSFPGPSAVCDSPLLSLRLWGQTSDTERTGKAAPRRQQLPPPPPLQPPPQPLPRPR